MPHSPQRREITSDFLIGALAVLPFLVATAALGGSNLDFPLNDDPTYITGLHAFLRDGTPRYYNWAAMPLIGLWLWAAPFVVALGPNIHHLRLAIAILAAVGLVAVRRHLRHSGAGLVPSFVATATVAAYPLWTVNLAPFMSDIPAVVFSSLMVICCYAGGTGPIAWAPATASFGVLAVVTRQNTIAAPTACLALLLLSGERRLSRWSAVLIPCITWGVVIFWMRGRTDVIAYSPELPGIFRSVGLVLGFVGYLGLLAFPLALFDIDWTKSLRRLPSWLLVAAIVLTVAAVLYKRYTYFGLSPSRGGLVPSLDNTIGVRGAFDTGFILGVRPTVLSLNAQVLLTGAACFGFAYLLQQAVRSARAFSSLHYAWTTYSLVHLVLLAISPSLFDRYFLVFAVPCAFFLAHSARHFNRLTTLAWAVVTLLFFTAGTALYHDWLAWNSARWSLARRYAQTSPTSSLEGGWEWDVWTAINEDRLAGSGGPDTPLNIAFNRRRVRSLSARCGISFSPIAETAVVETLSYWTPLAPGHRQMLLVCTVPTSSVTRTPSGHLN